MTKVLFYCVYDCMTRTFCDGISYDVYSLKSLYDSLYNDKMLSSYMYICFFFVICNCSHAVLPSIFVVPMRECMVGWALVHEFLVSCARAGWCSQARAWVPHFSTAVLVILYVWISSFHHLIKGWVPVWYILQCLFYKCLCNFYAQFVLCYCSHDLSFFDYLSPFFC